ncbi:M28 family peptidase [Sphingomonas montana]|uniref:M28 family peptidase n=1 Tax=Sphingomonas montana TaxID=1843236 RepID=UPI00096D8751|nr:M28 family peptidase [Sphingomonas montana]
MIDLRTAALLPLLALSAPAAAAPITEAALARHIDVLASNAYEGRKPGTPGAVKAVTYIAGAFRNAGLVPGAADGSWYQTVAFVERMPVSTDLRIGDRHESEVVATGLNPRIRIVDAPVVFAGYGIVGEGRDDLNGVSLAGAIVLIRGGTPKGMAHPPRPAERVAALLDRGARAVLTITPAGAAWVDVASQVGRGSTMLATAKRPAVQGAISHAAFARLTPAAPALLAAADGAAFRPVTLARHMTMTVETQVRPFASWNVIGRRAGTAAQGKAVLFTGHWDHLGICRPAGAADRICNGAVDNASGIASLIETARQLGAGPKPVRDEVFIATTGEELGLLGMEAWAAAPTVPLTEIVAAINVDTVAIAPRGLPVAIVGRGLTRLDPIVDATARRLGRRVDDDLEANAFIDRQDGAVLVRRGVPAVMIGGSFSDLKRLQAFLGGAYHGPTDNPGHGVVLGGAAEDADLTVAVARVLVDPVAYPAP